MLFFILHPSAFILFFRGQEGNQASRVGLRRVVAVLLDVLDDPRRLLPAHAEQVGNLPPADPPLQAEHLQASAETVAECEAFLKAFLPELDRTLFGNKGG